MKSLQGHLLIASSLLGDPNFAQTVLLIVQHDENGALGLVLNRPVETTVKDALEDSAELTCNVEDAIYQGGPCQGPLMVLHSDPHTSDAKVIDGVFFSTEREKVEQLLAAPPEKARFFVGYSGWSPGQLDNEMEAGSWLATPANLDWIFTENEEQWRDLITQLTLGRWVDPNKIADDPSVN